METAYTGIFATEVTDTFCPERDVDYWSYTTTGEGKLLSVSLSYNKVAKDLRLAMALEGPVGRCVNTPADACVNVDDCRTGGGELCDVARGGCKPTANLFCTTAAHCAPTTACVEASESIATLIEPEGNSASLHLLNANFAASRPGTHTIKVFDLNENLADDKILYRLNVIEKDDPDANEPNDHENTATALAVTVGDDNGNTATGYLAALADQDWYRIEPTGGGQQLIVTVDLSWPQEAAIDPAWQLRSNAQFVRGNRDVVTVDRVKTLRSRLIGPPAGETIFVTVFHEDLGRGKVGYDDALPYTLTVTVHTDSNEPTARNDSPATAEVMSLTANAPSANPTGQQATDSIIADDDVDWFKVNAEVVPGLNSLLYAQIDGPLLDTAPYILQLTIHRTCADTEGCDLCFGEAPNRDCIEPIYSLPYANAPEVVRDRYGGYRYGGRIPNRLATQVPIFVGREQSMYVSVQHIASTVHLVPGSTVDQSAAQNYTLTLAQQLEPEGPGQGSDADNPDNNFIQFPFLPGGAEVRRSDISNGVFRNVGGTSISTAAAVTGIAYPAPAAPLTAGMCNTVGLVGLDGQGAPLAANQLFDLSSTLPLGALVANCTDALPVEITSVSVGATGSFGLVLPAIPPATILTLGAGTAQVEATLQTATAAYFRYTSTTRGFSSNAVLPVTVGYGTSNASARTVTVSASNGGQVACVEQLENDGTPTGNCAWAAAAGRCGLTAIASCDVPIAIGDTTADIELSKTGGAGAVTLRMSDGTTVDPGFQAVAYVGNRLSPVSVTGFISYAGDNDFFRIPLQPGQFATGGGFTVRLQMAPSPVDIRASGLRGGGGASIGLQCPSRNAYTDRDQLCEYNAATGYNSDPDPMDESIGLTAGSLEFPGGPPVCSFTRSTAGELLIWVNDALLNDWDVVNPYTVTVEFIEGCSTQCTSFVCANAR